MKIILAFMIPTILSCIFFLSVMHRIKKHNFDKNGDRKLNWRNLTDDLLSSEIRYHNEAVYKAFEFYIKIILALFGAIGLASISKDYNSKNITIIIEYLGYATIGITALFGFLYISHQKAKIERWKRSFKWYEPLYWNECWLFSISIAIAFTVNSLLIPKLLENIVCCN